MVRVSWRVIWLAAGLHAIFLSTYALSQSHENTDRSKSAELQQHLSKRQKFKIRGTKPRYTERTLREDNISDVEIQQIERIVRAMVPGSIVNIGAVWAGCACEDGDACQSQVWVVASQPGSSTGLMLSRFADSWEIGPLQQWWLDYEQLQQKIKKVVGQNSYRAAMRIPMLREKINSLRQQQRVLQERFPFCSTDEDELY